MAESAALTSLAQENVPYYYRAMRFCALLMGCTVLVPTNAERIFLLLSLLSSSNSPDKLYSATSNVLKHLF